MYHSGKHELIAESFNKLFFFVSTHFLHLQDRSPNKKGTRVP